MKKETKKKYLISIVCEKEITTDVLQLFKFENDITFKKIQTDGTLGTEIIVEMEK